MAAQVIPGVLATLAMMTSSVAPRYEEPIVIRSEAATASCQTGRLDRYPPYLARGMQLMLVFRGPFELRPDARVIELLIPGFQVTPANINDASMLFLGSGMQASREAVDRLIRQACRIEQISGYRLITARTTDVRDAQRADAAAAVQHLAQARADRAAERRRAAEERAAHSRLLRSPPTVEELTPIVRDRWEEFRQSLNDAQFSRVRDVRCRRHESLFICQVGVLGTSARGPEYEQIEMYFGRQADGSVFYTPLLDPPVN